MSRSCNGFYLERFGKDIIWILDAIWYSHLFAVNSASRSGSLFFVFLENPSFIETTTMYIFFNAYMYIHLYTYTNRKGKIYSTASHILICWCLSILYFSFYFVNKCACVVFDHSTAFRVPIFLLFSRSKTWPTFYWLKTKQNMNKVGLWHERRRRRDANSCTFTCTPVIVMKVPSFWHTTNKKENCEAKFPEQQTTIYAAPILYSILHISLIQLYDRCW